MMTYISRRFLQTLLVILLLSFVCFYLMTLMPGDPVDMMASANPKIRAEDIQRLRSLYGLDLPPTVRYWNWLKDTLAGDFGYSRTYKVPVTELLAPRLINTFLLSVGSLGFSLLIAIPLGIWAALHSGTRTDYAINLFSFAGISLPSFWLGLLLILVFAVGLNWFPASGTESVGQGDLSGLAFLLDRLKYITLPLLSLTAMQIGTFVRFTRSAMVEAMRHDFIRTAKAKGLNRSTIIWRHAFRNALIPIITIIAISFGFTFSGAIITETIFAYQGVGKLVYESVLANDFNVAMVSFMISITMVLTMNLVADILYGVADPRISYK